MEDAMHQVTFRRYTLVAAVTALLTGAGALPAAALEESAHTVTISRALLSGAPRLEESMDVSALTPDSDFTVFMREGVPDDVHRAALGRLWVFIAPPVSCQELCVGEDDSAAGATRLASEKLPAAIQ
jgi:hypothetical protein